MRSVFLCIIYVIQSFIPVRFLKAIFEKRNIAKEFNTIEDIEKDKVQFLCAHEDDEIERLKRLKEKIEFEIEKNEFEIEKIENREIDKCEIEGQIIKIKEQRLKLKEELLSNLAEVGSMIEEIKRSSSFVFVTMKHTQELIKYNREVNKAK